MRKPSDGNARASRAYRKIVAVSNDQCRPELMSALVADGLGCDVVSVESIERGYSRIKHIAPDSIVVLVGIDDVPACRLLSMLKLDGDTCAIPLYAVMSKRELTGLDDIAAERPRDTPFPLENIQPN
jgi:hypothetical protein